MRCKPTLKAPVQKKAIGTATTIQLIIHEVDEDDSGDSDEIDELDGLPVQQDRFGLVLLKSSRSMVVEVERFVIEISDP